MTIPYWNHMKALGFPDLEDEDDGVYSKPGLDADIQPEDDGENSIGEDAKKDAPVHKDSTGAEVDDCNVGDVLETVKTITKRVPTDAVAAEATHLLQALVDYYNAVMQQNVSDHNNQRLTEELMDFIQSHKLATSTIIR
jgi:hypothetical protein